MEPNLEMPAGLHQALQRYSDEPRPGQEFSARLQAELAQRQAVLLRSRAPRRPFQRAGTAIWQLAQTRPLLALGLAVLGLLLVSGLAIAVSRLWVYIPGHGLVDPGTQVRSLAGPASQTQAGVTLTVQQALVAPDKTSLQFTVTGVPWDAIPQGTVEERDRLCAAQIELTLPDGTKMPLNRLDSGGYTPQNEYLRIAFFGPLPAGSDQAQLEVDCLPGTLRGKAPEHWQVALRFVPGPPAGAAAGVTEVPTPAAAGTETPNPAGPMRLAQVIETADGYIFAGSFQPPFAGGRVTDIMGGAVHIRDASGDPYAFSLPAGLDRQPASDGEAAWAYQIHEKPASWPVTIQIDSIRVSCPDRSARVEFDAGGSPQTGQIWQLNQSVQVGGCALRLAAIQRTSSGYLVSFDTSQDQMNPFISLETPGYPSRVEDSRYTIKYLDIHLVYPGGAPNGKVTLVISNVSEHVAGPWQVQWQPK